ncbi:MAG: sulfotransferase domain-containing protein [Nitrospirae bacterium]|nr:sulfotransferase domain-containing protein [Nitrospirota bacterium]MBF0519239.1 sulfotransferase domain-containing protein [Nitrospirota bacterium]MBF0535771.1 sulfotransferase domain-containing protein [Nitrospirota bacterium]MBF0617688.1 sulfotransferase domain-containing protein [Nitrospirota bacterium]
MSADLQTRWDKIKNTSFFQKYKPHNILFKSFYTIKNLSVKDLSRIPAAAYRNLTASISLVPAISFFALPRSASQSIAYALADTLKIVQLTEATQHNFTQNVISVRPYVERPRRGFIIYVHLPASNINLQTIRYYNVKCIAHIRDPRDAVLSLSRLIINKYNSAGIQSRLFVTELMSYEGQQPVTISEDIIKSGYHRVLDWILEHRYESFVKWVSDWISARNSMKELVHLTSYEEFVADSDSYFRNIYEFYDIKSDKMPPIYKRHFNKGIARNFETEMTPEQRVYATKMIPDLIYEHTLIRP